MKAAVMSLGSKSSMWIAEAMKKYFDSVASIDLRDVEVNIGSGKLKVLYEGKEIPQYSCIYARGSFRYSPLLRAVTRTLYRSSYMPIMPETFTIGHDKMLTHLALQHFNIPMPATYLASSTRAAKKILNEMNYPVVLKFPHGTQGKGVMFAESYAAASSMLDALIVLKQPFLIQEYIETGGVDVRAIVVGNEVVASMKRKAIRGEMRANIHAGGVGEAINLDQRTKRIAIDTAASIGADICAVDILESAKGPLVIEANLSPGLQGITKATGVDVADKIAKYLFEKSEIFSARDRDEATTKIFEDLGLNNEMAQQIITNMDFRGNRILLPKIVTDISKFTESDEVVLKVEKGKVVVEKI
ncbi:MAG TPA: RimK family alpha-L-glutamate ligase [Candidatus Nanoarchaeia archaeon]|nr:RimK family alpha-L-glutamate ligase [Candidatus Nanoarchaeia archaeon]